LLKTNPRKIGCSIAYFLRKRGLGVIVLERGDIGAQSSSAAAGLLAPIRPLSEEDPFKTLQIAGMKRLASFVPELEDISGVRVGYEQTGTLRLLPSDKIAAVPAWAEAWRKSGFHIEVLSAEEVRKREPHLYPDVPGAVSIADEAQVSPAQLVKAYERAARRMGALFYDHREVAAVQPTGDGGKIAGVWTQKKQRKLITCKQLVIAAGAWSSQFGEWLHVPLPVRPVRGELIALQQPSPPIRHILFDEGIIDLDVYLAPKPDNTLVIRSNEG
jgi:glycine oxidase